MSNFLCADCSSDILRISEYYILKDKIWSVISPDPNVMLCIGCAEKRLNRRLLPADFSAAPINDEYIPFPLDSMDIIGYFHNKMSERLKSRLGYINNE